MKRECLAFYIRDISVPVLNHSSLISLAFNLDPSTGTSVWPCKIRHWRSFENWL